MKNTASKRRILRVSGRLWGSGEQITHDYNLPSMIRLFQNIKDVKSVAGEFFTIDSAEVIDEYITTRTNITKII